MHVHLAANSTWSELVKKGIYGLYLDLHKQLSSELRLDKNPRICVDGQ